MWSFEVSEALTHILLIEFHVIGLLGISLIELADADPPVVRATVGDRVQLNCSTRNKSEVSPDWSHKRSTSTQLNYVYIARNLVNGYKFRYEIDHRNDADHHLIIPKVELRDSGIFTCTENEGFGKTLTRVNLIVSRPEPFQMIPNNTACVEKGSELRVKCVTGLNEPVDFIYRRNQNEQQFRLYANNFIVDSLGGRVSVDADSERGVYRFIVRGVTEEQSGEYMCVEDSGLGPGSGRVNVNVSVDCQVERGVTIPDDDDASVQTTNDPSRSADDKLSVLFVTSAIAVSVAIVIVLVVVIVVIRKRRHQTKQKAKVNVENGPPPYSQKSSVNSDKDNSSDDSADRTQTVTSQDPLLEGPDGVFTDRRSSFCA